MNTSSRQSAMERRRLRRSHVSLNEEGGIAEGEVSTHQNQPASVPEDEVVIVGTLKKLEPGTKWRDDNEPSNMLKQIPTDTFLSPNNHPHDSLSSNMKQSPSISLNRATMKQSPSFNIKQSEAHLEHSPGTPRRRRKQKDPVLEQGDKLILEFNNESARESALKQSPSFNTKESEVEYSTGTRRRKQKDPDLKEGNQLIQEPNQTTTLDAASNPVTPVVQEEFQIENHWKENQGKILGIHIHSMDTLSFDRAFYSNPIVKIHIIDINTGQYLLKSSKDRGVTCFTDQGRTDTILPVLSQPCKLRKLHTNIPQWNEEIVYNEFYNHIIQARSLFLFEVLDFDRKQSKGDGWVRICWGFLKAIDSNGHPYTEQKLRLQLYQYPYQVNTTKEVDKLQIPYIYKCWNYPKRTRFDSTLYVTIKACGAVGIKETTHRALMPTEIEKSPFSLSQMKLDNKPKEIAIGNITNEIIHEETIPWRRFLGQRCHIPNKPMYRIDAGRMGCFHLAFSKSGFYLAAATTSDDAHTLKIYDILTGQRIIALNGHQDLIYDLSWSSDERYLISGSADMTVKCWNVYEENINHPKQSFELKHPAYVYASQFHPTSPTLLFTAGYDRVIRVWRIPEEDSHEDLIVLTQPVMVLAGHSSHINCLDFDVTGERFLSGDGNGVLKLWRVQTDDIRVENTHTINKIAITFVQFHPTGRKALVSDRLGRVRLLDLRLYRFISEYDIPESTSSVSERSITFIQRAIFSPCGSFVYAHGFMNNLHVFNMESTALMGTYEFGYSTPISSVSFHPWDHTLAIGNFGSHQPIFVYTWDDEYVRIERKYEEEQAKIMKEKTLGIVVPSLPPMQANKVIKSVEMSPTEISQGEMLNLSGRRENIRYKEANVD